MGKNDDNGGYFSDILKEGLTDSEMSGWGRVWSIGVGLVGTVVADPVIWASKSLVSRANLVITIRAILPIRATRIIKLSKEKAPLPKAMRLFF